MKPDYKASWAIIVASFAVALGGMVFFVYQLTNNSQQAKQIEVITKKAVCVADIHSSACQTRTCIRLADTGYGLTRECRKRLGFLPGQRQQKGVDANNGSTRSPSNQPSPAPSGGGAPQENPPANLPQPPDTVEQVCGVSGNLGVQVPLVC